MAQRTLSISASKTTLDSSIPDILEFASFVDQLQLEDDLLLLTLDELIGSEEGLHEGMTELGTFIRIEIANALNRIMHPQFVGQFVNHAHCLPAGRSGIMSVQNVILRALIRSSATTRNRSGEDTPLLSGILADFLEQLVTLDSGQEFRQKDRSAVASQIEQGVLGGDVKVRKSEVADFPLFTFMPGGSDSDMPLRNASSMVSELAPLVLHLRYLVLPGDVMIIEEPEAHLHPGMQVRLIQEIARLVNSGVRVLITTHSEWVLEELANIVGRSAIPDPDLPALQANNVGAWLFKPQEIFGHSQVTEISIHGSGLHASDLEDVAIALHNDWAKIQSESRK